MPNTQYILHFNYVAILLQTMILIVNFIYNNLPARTSRIYRVLVFFSLVSSIVSTLSAFLTGNAAGAENLLPYTAVIVLNVFLNNVIAPIYFLFTVSLTHEQLKFERHHYVIVLVPLLILLILIGTSPLTHFVMYYSADGIYHDGIGMHVCYTINSLYVLYANVLLFRHKDRVSAKQIIIVTTYTVFIISAIIFQALFPYVLTIQLATAISIFLMYFSLRNPSEFVDRNNGCYNRTAFKEFFFTKNLMKKNYSMGIIHLTNLDSIKQNFGTSNAFYLLRQNLQDLQKIINFNQFFYLYHDTFVIVHQDPEVVKFILETVNEHVPRPMEIHAEDGQPSGTKISVQFSYDLFFLQNIETLKLDSLISNLRNPTDKLIDLLEFTTTSDTHFEGIANINDEMVQEYQNTVKIQQAIQQAIADDSFEVYLQPIYDFNTNSFTSAESLLRLKDKDGSFIPPTRFIHQAELNGTILQLGDISIRKTCQYINNAKLLDLGIKKVNINLSIIQCMQENIVKHLTNILDEYNIPHQMIRFEITETLMAKDPERLHRVMYELNALGIEFALDDYGTGYSNTSRLLEYPFSEIKFDKSFIDSTMENEKNGIPLKHLMNMVKDTGRLVLVEGVETKDMSELVRNFGGDLIQGYYYSKPLPQEDFVKLIKEKQN